MSELSLDQNIMEPLCRNYKELIMNISVSKCNYNFKQYNQVPFMRTYASHVSNCCFLNILFSLTIFF